MNEPDQAFDQSGASTFAYSEADIQRILCEIEEGDIPQSGTTLNGDIKRELLSLQKKEISYNLHVISLAQYARSKRIPRGLCQDIKPNLCADDPLLIQRWQEICNKCSLDLIILTVERLQARLQTVRQRIVELKELIMRDKGAELAAAIFQDHEEQLRRHTENVAECKKAKFQRDAQDYRLNQVYTWREVRRKQHQQQLSPTHQQGSQRGRRYPNRHHSEQRNTRPAYNRRDPAVEPRSFAKDSSSSSDLSGTSFLDQGAVFQKKKKKNPRAPIPREQYPSRQRN
ncbi:hypothetical protein XELAEV_18010839mg [Xenopus laevis]|uniref:Uncharacterized protein n=1 Tax=Xenopus laevis TaxID=8355 RepID=A0A974DUZ7_XENLA|nr:hypothetical protein XELAEV_18010839mg [Xenopus laevis]